MFIRIWGVMGRVMCPHVWSVVVREESKRARERIISMLYRKCCIIQRLADIIQRHIARRVELGNLVSS